MIERCTKDIKFNIGFSNTAKMQGAFIWKHIVLGHRFHLISNVTWPDYGIRNKIEKINYEVKNYTIKILKFL